MFFGVTRFSVYLPKHKAWRLNRGSSEEEYLRILFADERLQPRFDIFLGKALPIYQEASKQYNYRHIVHYSDSLPEKWKKLLFEAAEKNSVLYLNKVETSINTNDVILKILQEQKAVSGAVAWFRIDDDDILGLGYFKKLATYVRPEMNGLALSFPSGIAGLYSDGVFDSFGKMKYRFHSTGLAYIGTYDSDKKTVSFPKDGDHTLQDSCCPTILDGTAENMYIYTFHKGQDTAENLEKNIKKYKSKDINQSEVSDIAMSFPTIKEDINRSLNNNKGINTKKLLLCRPHGGLNDNLCQIERCLEYALDYDRELYIDGSRSGFLDSFENYFVPPEGIHLKDIDFLTPPFDVYPHCLSDNITTFERKFSSTLGNHVHITDTLLSFDFKKSYSEQLLVHEQCGGGTNSINVLLRFTLKENIRLHISKIIENLGEYDAIHVRHTDYKTDYKKFFSDISDKLGDKIVLCTDSYECQVYAKSLWKERLHIVTNIPDTKGVRLHTNPNLDRFQTNLGTLVDLFVLACSKNLYITNIINKEFISGFGKIINKEFISGFGKLAHLLQGRKNLIEKLLWNKKATVDMPDIACVSLGENALADDILKRHGLKSFSTPYSDARSNIDYAIFLESRDYKGLLERENLKYDSKVVRSTIANNSDNIYDQLHINGFEFANDVLGSDETRDNFNAKIQRLLELRAGKQVMFFYHHRVNKNSNLESIFEKARKFLEFYSQKEQALMVIFTQKIIKNKSERKLSYRKVSNTIHFFEFCTEQFWGGNNPDIRLAIIDEDLVKEMIQSSVGIVQSRFAK